MKRASFRTYLLILFFVAVGIGSSFAQGIVDCINQDKTVVVSALRGSVVDRNGSPIPNAQVWLSRDETPLAKADTDSAGRFNFKVDPGQYTLRAQAQGFEITKAEVNVGKDIATAFRLTGLKVILALPGMNCPWVTASNKEYKEFVHNHATQK